MCDPDIQITIENQIAAERSVGASSGPMSVAGPRYVSPYRRFSASFGLTFCFSAISSQRRRTIEACASTEVMEPRSVAAEHEGSSSNDGRVNRTSTYLPHKKAPTHFSAAPAPLLPAWEPTPPSRAELDEGLRFSRGLLPSVSPLPRLLHSAPPAYIASKYVLSSIIWGFQVLS